jgi:hypothetical protein
MAETTVNAQLINWFQAGEKKIRPVAFALPPITPKNSGNMSLFFLAGIFFLRHSEEVSDDLFTSAVCRPADEDWKGKRATVQPWSKRPQNVEGSHASS